MPTYHMIKRSTARRRKRNMPGMILRSRSSGKFVTGGFRSRTTKKGKKGPVKGSRVRDSILVTRVPRGARASYGSRRVGGGAKGITKKQLLSLARTFAPKRRRKARRSVGRRLARQIGKRTRLRGTPFTVDSRGTFGVSRKRARRANPGRKRRRSSARRRGRRSNPGRVVYVRRRGRRSSRRRRSNPFGISIPRFAGIFSKETAVQVVGAGVGFSASLWGPKLAGHGLWAPLGRGWGGVATSLGSVAVTSWAIGKVSAQAGRSAWIGGLVGVLAGGISALATTLWGQKGCGVIETAFPFQSSMLACALPTRPPVDAQSRLLSASIAARAAGQIELADQLQNQAGGMAGFSGGSYASGLSRKATKMLAMEAGSRGIGEFIKPGGRLGSFPTGLKRASQPVTGMDSHKEGF